MENPFVGKTYRINMKTKTASFDTTKRKGHDSIIFYFHNLSRTTFLSCLACFVEEAGDSHSEHDAGAAVRQWPGAEPLLQVTKRR
ncbi:MAG: hypothetical protein PWQ91_1694 [Eubacteriales bacterium]|nr:hypothetical protein [Eubacteriales bacterium]